MNILTTLNLALKAYILWVETGVERELDNLEDEIDHLASLGLPCHKLRIEALSQRLSRKRERFARSGDDPLA